MTRASFSASLLLLSLIAAQPALAQEQSRYTIAGVFGLFLPTADLVTDQLVPAPGPLEPDRVTIDQVAGPVLGARLSRTLSSTLQLEAELLYAFSQGEARGPRREPQDEVGDTLPAHVVVVGADVLFEVFRAPFTPFAIHLLGGLGLVIRGGEFFDEGGGVFETLEGGTDVALILGTGFRYGLSPRLGLRLDVRDYLSSYQQELPGGEADSQLQNDLWIVGALEYSF